MKLIIFYGSIWLSLLGSLFLGKKDLYKHKNAVISIIKAILFNFIILGLGSIWWFLTETDGLSQGIGVLIYISSMIAISFIDIIAIKFFMIRKNK
jgi:hypothetical protein